MTTTTPDTLLAIDQGTTSTRAILFEAAGGIRYVAQRELRQIYPRPGWVEHDPEEIWQAVVSTCREAVAAAPGPITAIGITNQRETTVLWDRATGRPVHNAIVWRDRRTAGICQRWHDDGLGDRVAARTGLVIDPYFSASKIRWLLDNVEGLASRAAAGEIAFGTIDTFLVWRLSGGQIHATDATNASRTMLYDLNRLDWDDDLLAHFGIPRAMVPEVRGTGADYGTSAASELGQAIPIAAVAGDQQAALIGQGCFRPGMAKSTYGTGAFALVHTGAKPAASTHRLLTTIAYRLGGETAYALEGAIFVAGAAVQWLRDRLGAVSAAAETDALARGADAAQRVYLVPAFTGLGAPYWEPEARGALFGLTAECGRAEIARAVLEAAGHQTADLIVAMQADGAPPIETLRVDGGMSASEIAMQFLADIIPVAVERPPSVETTAWGAAYVAGYMRGVCPSPAEMMTAWRAARRFTPAMADGEREERRAGWKRAVAGVLAAAAR